MVDLLRVNILVDAIMFHIGAFFCKFLILITIDLDFVLLMVLYYCLSSLSTKRHILDWKIRLMLVLSTRTKK